MLDKNFIAISNKLSYTIKANIIFFYNKSSRLEDLANEIYYKIFEYLDTYHAYKGFYYLNKRFENLFIDSNYPRKIKICVKNVEMYEKEFSLTSTKT